VNEELAERYAEALCETLGYPGRMISYSKSDYVVERHPDHVAVFNANVCIAEGKLWHGDLDLTLDEPKLAALAEQISEIVYVLYERDGRFGTNEDEPLLHRAVYSVTPTGHTRYPHKYIARDADGTLRKRPLPPRPRWHWRVLAHRPRLIRFWIVERRKRCCEESDHGRSSLIYVGNRNGGDDTPLLVLGVARGEHPRSSSFELTWHPGGTHERSAARELFKLNLATPSRWRLHLSAHLRVWPGSVYTFRATYRIRW
jgi:hypothetical protein